SVFSMGSRFPDVAVPLLRPPTIPPLFPYTTLFRSHDVLFESPQRHESRNRHGRREPLERAGEGCGGGRIRPQHVPAEEDRKVQRSEEHTSELQSRENLVCRLLLEKKKKKQMHDYTR